MPFGLAGLSLAALIVAILISCTGLVNAGVLALVFAARFWQGKWRSMRVIEPAALADAKAEEAVAVG